jgi:hypothetical protein
MLHHHGYAFFCHPKSPFLARPAGSCCLSSVVSCDPKLHYRYVSYDVQERDSSIMSLSVQIYTVPSLATYLIQTCDAISKLLDAFHSLLRYRQQK